MVASRKPPQSPGPARKVARGTNEGSGGTEARRCRFRRSNDNPGGKDQQGRAGTGESTAGQSAQQTWEAHVKAKSGLEARISLLDRLVEFLGLTGAMTAQASSRIGSFTESVNIRLAAFGYACNFTLDPFQIRVTSSEDNHCGLSWKQLSESGQFRFSVAFQVALATVTGLRFVD
jgi:hypothetical protein